jgi:EAL domain-containing protein (putative c-di-GMP-specific phosphodiesterase class I)
MLEISEDQNLDLNSGARQRLLAHEQLGFTLAMDDYGTGYSVLQRLHTLPFGAVSVDRCLIDACRHRKNLLKAAGTLAGKTAAAVALADVESCRPGEPSQQIAEIRTA